MIKKRINLWSLGQWWVLNEQTEAHLLWWMERRSEQISHAYSACGLNINRTIEEGFLAKGVFADCRGAQLMGACAVCVWRIVSKHDFSWQEAGLECPSPGGCRMIEAREWLHKQEFIDLGYGAIVNT